MQLRPGRSAEDTAAGTRGLAHAAPAVPTLDSRHGKLGEPRSSETSFLPCVFGRGSQGQAAHMAPAGPLDALSWQAWTNTQGTG